MRKTRARNASWAIIFNDLKKMAKSNFPPAFDFLENIFNLQSKYNLIFFAGPGGAGKTSLIKEYLGCEYNEAGGTSTTKTLDVIDISSAVNEIFEDRKDDDKKVVIIDTPGDRDQWQILADAIKDKISSLGVSKSDVAVIIVFVAANGYSAIRDTEQLKNQIKKEPSRTKEWDLKKPYKENELRTEKELFRRIFDESTLSEYKDDPAGGYFLLEGLDFVRGVLLAINKYDHWGKIEEEDSIRNRYYPGGEFHTLLSDKFPNDAIKVVQTCAEYGGGPDHESRKKLSEGIGIEPNVLRKMKAEFITSLLDLLDRTESKLKPDTKVG